jgi:hypothetical protein
MVNGDVGVIPYRVFKSYPDDQEHEIPVGCGIRMMLIKR